MVLFVVNISKNLLFLSNPQTDLEIGGSVKVKIEHKVPNKLLVTVQNAENVGKTAEETQLLVSFKTKSLNLDFFFQIYFFE